MRKAMLLILVAMVCFLIALVFFARPGKAAGIILPPVREIPIPLPTATPMPPRPTPKPTPTQTLIQGLDIHAEITVNPALLPILATASPTPGKDNGLKLAATIPPDAIMEGLFPTSGVVSTVPIYRFRRPRGEDGWKHAYAIGETSLQAFGEKGWESDGIVTYIAPYEYLIPKIGYADPVVLWQDKDDWYGGSEDYLSRITAGPMLGNDWKVVSLLGYASPLKDASGENRQVVLQYTCLPPEGLNMTKGNTDFYYTGEDGYYPDYSLVQSLCIGWNCETPVQEITMHAVSPSRVYAGSTATVSWDIMQVTGHIALSYSSDGGKSFAPLGELDWTSQSWLPNHMKEFSWTVSGGATPAAMVRLVWTHGSNPTVQIVCYTPVFEVR